MTGIEPIDKYYVNGHFLSGYSMTRLYARWQGMKERCYNPKSKRYENYGQKGITICDEWKNNFKAFGKWSIDNGYAENLTIDRIDVSKGYEPNNCRWVTDKVQQNNRSNNHRIECNGVTHTLAEWSDISGISPDNIRERIKSGWEIEKAIFHPVMSMSEAGTMGCDIRWHSK